MVAVLAHEGQVGLDVGPQLADAGRLGIDLGLHVRHTLATSSLMSSSLPPKW
jgi:hypothetical protein